MDECPVCSKDVPDRDAVAITAAGACSVCGLAFTTDTRATEYEMSEDERARLAEIRRLQRIAHGPEPKSAQMTRMKGLLALLIIIFILVYVYISNKQRQETAQLNRIEVTYRGFNVLFGPGSPLTDDEKLEEFKYWRNSPVRWNGTVTYVNLGAEDDLYVTVTRPSRHPVSDVLVRFPETWRDRLEGLKAGQTIRFSGRISEYDRGTSFITIRQGALIGDPR